MPTIASSRVPPPKSWDEFEDITLAAVKLRWKSANFQRNGRNGQKQDGVDVFGYDDKGRHIGVQCKNIEAILSLKDIEEEVARARGFEPPLDCIYIAMTTKRDAPLQKAVRALSAEREKAGDHPVRLLFWDDIYQDLSRDSAIFRAHYPQIGIQEGPAREHDTERALALLELGFFGAELWEYITLTLGETGWIAQLDPDDTLATFDLLEKRARLVLEAEYAEPIVEALKTVRECCNTGRTCVSEWGKIEVCAKRVGTRLVQVQGALSLPEQNILDLAMQLARIYHHLEDGPSDVLIEQLGRKLRGVLPEASEPRVVTALTAVGECRSGYSLAQKLYSLLEQELRWA